MKTILITGIGGLTPRSIAKIIRKNHPDYKLIGCDIDKKAIGFFMKGLLDENKPGYEITEKDFANGTVDSSVLSTEKDKQLRAYEAFENGKAEIIN